MPMKTIPQMQSNRPLSPFQQYMRDAAPMPSTGGSPAMNAIRSSSGSRAPASALAVQPALRQAVTQGAPETVTGDEDAVGKEYIAARDSFLQRGGTDADWVQTPQYQNFYKRISGILSTENDPNQLQSGFADTQRALDNIALSQSRPGEGGSYSDTYNALNAIRSARLKDLGAATKASADITDPKDPGYLAWVVKNIGGNVLGGGGGGDTSLAAYNASRKTGTTSPSTSTPPATAATGTTTNSRPDAPTTPAGWSAAIANPYPTKNIVPATTVPVGSQTPDAFAQLSGHTGYGVGVDPKQGLQDAQDRQGKPYTPYTPQSLTADVMPSPLTNTGMSASAAPLMPPPSAQSTISGSLPSDNKSGLNSVTSAPLSQTTPTGFDPSKVTPL